MRDNIKQRWSQWLPSAAASTIARSTAAGLAMLSHCILFSTTVSAEHAKTCESLCTEPKHTAAYVKIDANTGAIKGGSTRFGRHQQIQIILANKNPFKYSYRFEIVSMPQEQEVVSRFLKLIPDYSMFDPLAAKTQVSDSVGALRESGENLKTSLNRLAKIDALVQRFVESTDTDVITCKKACMDALAVKDSIGLLLETATLEKRIAEYSERVKALGPSENDERQRAVLNELNDDANAFTEAIKRIKDNRQSYEHIRDIIKNAFTQNGPFYEEHYSQDTGGPTAVRVTIYRRNLRVDGAKETLVARIDIQAGKSGLSLSVGFGVSSLQQRTVVRQSAVVGDTLGTVFGYEENSELSPRTLVMLNGSIIDVKSVSFGIDIGVVVGSAVFSELEYVLGATCGLLDDKLILTIGAHLARVESLAGGFEIGDPVPPGLSDPLPVENSYEAGVMFAVTFRVK